MRESCTFNKSTAGGNLLMRSMLILQLHTPHHHQKTMNTVERKPTTSLLASFRFVSFQLTHPCLSRDVLVFRVMSIIHFLSLRLILDFAFSDWVFLQTSWVPTSFLHIFLYSSIISQCRKWCGHNRMIGHQKHNHQYTTVVWTINVIRMQTKGRLILFHMPLLSAPLCLSAYWYLYVYGSTVVELIMTLKWNKQVETWNKERSRDKSALIE